MCASIYQGRRPCALLAALWKRVEPFSVKLRFRKTVACPVTQSLQELGPHLQSLECLGQVTFTLRISLPPASLCILLSPVLWIGQKGQGPGRTLGELGSSGHGPAGYSEPSAGLLPRRVGGIAPLPGASSAAGARAKLPAAGDKEAHTAGARTQTPTLRGGDWGCSHSRAWGPGHLEGMPRPHPYCTHQGLPRDSRAGTKSFMSGVLGRLRNEGSATCARSASLYPVPGGL